MRCAAWRPPEARRPGHGPPLAFRRPWRPIAGAPALPEASQTVTPSRSDLFTGYLKIGLFGFGGVAAWARRVIVEERRWMSERDYAEILGLGQVLPGPNVGNAAVMIGRRFHGLAGALLTTA